MLLKIKTGHNGLRQFPMEEIVILVANLPSLTANGHAWLFTDRNARLDYANFHSGLSELACLDWSALQARDFRRDPDKPDKLERYMAEALVHNYLPLSGLAGIVCHGPAQKEKLKLMSQDGNIPLPVEVRPSWYF